MNRRALALSAVLAVSIAFALMYARDLHRERGRADALAARLSELEPLERGGSAVGPSSDLTPELRVQVEPVAEASTAQPTPADMPQRPKTIMEYRGTHRSRRLVERLQSALATGAPLQDYQIQPLISAIDAAHSDNEQQRTQRLETGREANRRIVLAASDILFESQLETLIALLDLERAAE